MFATHYARAVPVRRHPRLHRKGPGLLRRRPALQHQLHPVLRHRHGHGQPVGHQDARLRRRARRHGRSSRRPRTPISTDAEALRLKLLEQDAHLRQRRRPRRRRSCSASTTPCFDAIDGRPNTKGTAYHLNMLSTTCHVYFGKMLGATPDGRLRRPARISDGTSPSHGADRNGPTAVVKSLAQDGPDQVRRHPAQPALPAGRPRRRTATWTSSASSSAPTSGSAATTSSSTWSTPTPCATPRPHPDEYRDLLVRVAGYSDYFVDLDLDHQEEIIRRTAQAAADRGGRRQRGNAAH